MWPWILPKGPEPRRGSLFGVWSLGVVALTTNNLPFSERVPINSMLVLVIKTYRKIYRSRLCEFKVFFRV